MSSTAPSSPKGCRVDATVVTPLGMVLALVALTSTGTGIFWNAISFVAFHGYQFSQTRNFTLYLVMGTVYVVAAFRSGATLRSVERIFSPRAVVAIVLVIQSLVCTLPVVFAGEWALWTAVITTSITSATLWPVVESYIASGRHGPDMRAAIGWFNLTWMIAVIVPLLVMPPILEEHAAWAIGGFAVVNMAALPLLLGFRRAPQPHDHAIAAQHVPAHYPALARSARTLLPICYLLIAGISPILPYRFDALGAAAEIQTPIASIWMASRVGLLIVMWRVPFWHGRWGVLALAALAMAGGFALAVIAPSLWLMGIALATFGLGVGAIYHLALYYGMAVDRADVDAGGRHEGLIGLGYAAGPAAGLIGVGLGPPTGIVVVMLAVAGAGCVAAALPYWRREDIAPSRLRLREERQRRQPGEGPPTPEA